MVATTSTPRAAPATGPPTAVFEAIVERYGTIGLLKFLGALLAFTLLHVLLRLPLLVLLRAVDALMARVGTPVAAGFPGRPTPTAAYGGSTA